MIDYVKASLKHNAIIAFIVSALYLYLSGLSFENGIGAVSLFFGLMVVLTLYNFIYRLLGVRRSR